MKRENIMKLWLQCFGDSEEFVRFYFDRKFREEESLICYEGDEPVAASLMLPYPLVWRGGSFTTAYISGACTAEKARNQGVMTRLLKEGFRQMYENGIVLSTLIPAEEWLFGYYARLGYATLFYKSTVHRQLTAVAPSGCSTEFIGCTDDSAIEESYTYFSKKMQEIPCYISHNLEDYRTILGDLFLSKGKLIVARSPQNGSPICGLAMATEEEGEVTVKELLYDSPERGDQLLTAAAGYWNTTGIYYRSRQPDPAAQPYGMARIIHPEPLLKHYAALHPQTEETICLADSILPANQGRYRISQGVCRKIDNSLSPSATDISLLPQKLFAFPEEMPYMNLMID